MGRPFWRLLPIIDDEERAGVEPVGTLAPNDREEGTELALDGLQELRPEAGSIMQELMEGLSEALDREFSSVVLVFAEKVLFINLINLHPTDAHTQAGRGALCTLVHVTGLLLLGRVISMLPGPHLQVQDTGVLVL